MRSLGGRDPCLKEGIRARQGGRGGPSRAGSSSWRGAGAIPHVAARVAGNMLITLCSSVLSSEALRAIHRQQLVCAARPRRSQIPFFPSVFTGGGWQREAAQAAGRVQRGRGRAWSSQVPAAWGGLVARASRVAPRPFITQVWPFAAGCASCHYFWAIFVMPFQPGKPCLGLILPTVLQSLFLAMFVVTRAVSRWGVPTRPPPRWGPAPPYQSGQPRAAAPSRHERDLHRKQDLHRRPGDHASRSTLSEPAALRLSARLSLYLKQQPRGTPRDVNAGTVNERCRADNEARQVKTTAWGDVRGLATRVKHLSFA